MKRLNIGEYYLDDGITIVRDYESPEITLNVDGVLCRVLEKTAHSRTHLFAYGNNAVEIARKCPKCKTFKRRSDFPKRHRKDYRLDMCNACYLDNITAPMEANGLKTLKEFFEWSKEQDRRFHEEEELKRAYRERQEREFWKRVKEAFESIAVSEEFDEEDDEDYEEYRREEKRKNWQIER